MINQILKVMVGLSHFLFPSKGLLNEQSFEPGSMENHNLDFPSFNIKNLKAKLPKTSDITLENFHKFVLNSCKSFNRAEFLLAVQLGILIYFPGVALSIIYQEYQFEMQQQQQLEQEFEEQEQENQQELDPQSQSLQDRSSTSQFIKQSQEMVAGDTMQLTQQPFTRFIQLLQQMIQQLMQQPQDIYNRQIYNHQYHQDCNYQIQCQFSDQYEGQFQNQNQQVQQMQENLIKQEQVQCIIMKVTRTTKSTQNNENGGVRITLVINLPGEGGQYQFVENNKKQIHQNQFIIF